MDQDCHNCKFKACTVDEIPCSTCRNETRYSNWESYL